jgi:hypothetical protein
LEIRDNHNTGTIARLKAAIFFADVIRKDELIEENLGQL